MTRLIPDEASTTALGNLLGIEGIERANQSCIGDVDYRRTGALEHLDIIGFIIGAEITVIRHLGHS